MSSEIRIAIDAMGGDNGADVVVPGALRALKKHPNLHLVLVGDERILKLYLSRYKNNVGSRLTLQHASEVVSMDESPTQALRYKKIRLCVLQLILSNNKKFKLVSAREIRAH